MAEKAMVKAAEGMIGHVWEQIVDLSNGQHFSRYADSFSSEPACCPKCDTPLTFNHRVAAALALSAHARDNFQQWFDNPPTRNEKIKGIVLCSECQNYTLTNMLYAYPTFPEMLVSHTIDETDRFAAI
ncbi:MAG: hypothetical protein ABJH45_02525 [Paracoccaceae bacterium]